MVPERRHPDEYPPQVAFAAVREPLDTFDVDPLQAGMTLDIGADPGEPKSERANAVEAVRFGDLDHVAHLLHGASPTPVDGAEERPPARRSSTPFRACRRA